MFIDSHAHLDDDRFDLDRDILIKNLKDNKIELVLNIGADLETSLASIDLAEKYENIYATVGVHPHSAKYFTEETYEKFKELAAHKKLVAIGEIGLDFYYDNSPRDVQRQVFRRQLELAKEVNLPVVIHSREATKESFDILKEASKEGVKGVLHSFSGSVEIAREYIKLGYYISIGGPVTFKNARVVKEVAKEVPLEYMLIETDCPYLTPEPYRGKRNEPMYVRYAAEKIAEIKGVTLEEVAKATSDNVYKLFNINRG